MPQYGPMCDHDKNVLSLVTYNKCYSEYSLVKPMSIHIQRNMIIRRVRDSFYEFWAERKKDEQMIESFFLDSFVSKIHFFNKRSFQEKTYTTAAHFRFHPSDMAVVLDRRNSAFRLSSSCIHVGQIFVFHKERDGDVIHIHCIIKSEYNNSEEIAFQYYMCLLFLHHISVD